MLSSNVGLRESQISEKTVGIFKSYLLAAKALHGEDFFPRGVSSVYKMVSLAL